MKVTLILLLVFLQGMKWNFEYSPKSISKNFTLKVLIPPPFLSAPFDVSVGPDGIAVVEVRTRKAIGLDIKGNQYEIAQNINGMYFDHDSSGNLYIYSFPDGCIYKFNKSNGKSTLLFKIHQGHSGGSICVTSDGKMVFVLFLDIKNAVSKIYKFNTKTKKGEWIETNNFFVKGIDSLGNKIYAVTDNSILLFHNNVFKKIIHLRKKLWISPSGFSIFSNKGFFVSFGIKNKGSIAFVDLKGRVYTILEAMDTPVDGIDYSKEDKVLWFVSKVGSRAGFLRIPSPYSLKKQKLKPKIFFSKNHLMTPIAIRVADNGDIYINGDEIGIYLIKKGLKPRIIFSNICSYQPPCADFEILGPSKLIYTWAAPGFKGAIAILRKKRRIKFIKTNAVLPSGITRLAKNKFLVLDYYNGFLYKFNLNGKTKVIGKNYKFPFGIAKGVDGSLYITCSKKNRKGNPRDVIPIYPEILIRRYPNGKEFVVFDTKKHKTRGSLFFVCSSPSGPIYFPAGSKILSYNPKNHKIETIAENFMRPAGIACDKNGNIFSTDYDANALVGLFKK